MPVYHPSSPLGIFTAYFDSTTCRCRDDKYRGQMFCKQCFKALPNEMMRQIQFNSRNDEDRMEAFDEAKGWLETSGL